MSEKTYNRDEVLKNTIKYFNGDDLAANVWINKYALKDSQGNLYESSPEDMHNRLANEIFRIENNYKNPISKEEIFNVLKDFKYIVPQGGPMSGIGNIKQTVSLSNCFVIGNDYDSYGGIMLTDQEQVQLMKRRGGVGHDLSHLRPNSSPVKNSALTSTGLVSFMERYSNSTREVGQDGRRGALMLSCSINHPDSEKFMDAKMEEGKVTGANVSMRITDNFMKSVIDDKTYTQQFPIDSNNPQIIQEVKAKPIFNKIVHNAWKSAEPGILFWDTIKKESVSDCYEDQGFGTTSTNPCGEIPLPPYDSCRLLALNLFSYVENPFTDKAKFNFDLFGKHSKIAQRIMDDIIDLEIEKIDQILTKIESDPETESIKLVEKNLWSKIRKMAVNGRRTGIGVTSEGDMIAALGLTYGTKKATKFSVKVHKELAINVYKASCELAKDRGSFEIYDSEKEKNNPFIKRLIKAAPELEDMLKSGRRNIALLTIAPTGTVSIMTQTTSGIEPVFLVAYKRRRKINPNDKDVRIDFVDENGDSWEEYTVFHHKFVNWLSANNYDIDEVKSMSQSDLNKIIEKSPYYKATSNDVDWLEKVNMQGQVQKWVDHSISVTVNLPKETTEKVVSDVYLTAWKSGCKGITVYRDGSRNGVLVSDKEEKSVEELIKESNAPKRPNKIECDILRFQNNKEKWIGFVGLLKGQPYEIFTGKLDSFQVPTFVDSGWIKKNREIKKDSDGNEYKSSRYDFVYFDKDGYEQEMRGLSRAFDREYWNYGKMCSAILRHGMPLPSTINLIDSLDLNGDSVVSWKSGIKRMLKKYIKDGDVIGQKCPECGNTELKNESGCVQCPKCGWSKCS